MTENNLRTAIKPKHPGGRPLKYKTVDQLNAVIERYFTNLEKEEIPTVTGLALELGLDRRGLIEYSEKPEFTNAIKKARSKIEKVVEQRLLQGKPPIGLIFWLKNNAGWRDEQTTRHEGQITHGFVALPPLQPVPKPVAPISVQDTK